MQSVKRNYFSRRIDQTKNITYSSQRIFIKYNIFKITNEIRNNDNQ